MGGLHFMSPKARQTVINALTGNWMTVEDLAVKTGHNWVGIFNVLLLLYREDSLLVGNRDGSGPLLFKWKEEQ